MSPVSSAMGMNRLGEIEPSVGWCQRSRASAPTISPFSRSTLGWYTSGAARRRRRGGGRSRSKRLASPPAGRRCGTARPRPRSLALYIAVSAARTSTSGSVPSSGNRATPMLTSMWTVRPWIRPAPRAGCEPSGPPAGACSRPPARRIAELVTPRRAARASSGSTSSSRSATMASSWLPVAWPRLSFTTLNRSSRRTSPSGTHRLRRRRRRRWPTAP